jgi:hypothetical protein
MGRGGAVCQRSTLGGDSEPRRWPYAAVDGEALTTEVDESGRLTLRWLLTAALQTRGRHDSAEARPVPGAAAHRRQSARRKEQRSGGDSA